MKNVVVLGKFDGIHMGHRALIKRASDIAVERNMRVIVYVIGGPEAGIITRDDDKKAILMLLGADEVRFRILDDEFRSMTPDCFVKEIISKELDAGYVVVGENFRFGKDRCADSNLLKSECALYGIETEIVETVFMDYADGDMCAISSSAIRNFLSKGDVESANKYLGRPFFIKGTVSEGKHLGRNIGFPTVNIYPSHKNLVPRDGVYATVIKLGDTLYNAVTNVGSNPTVEDGENIKIETHIFDFDKMCYGHDIVLYFAKFIRGEIHFDDVDQLVHQMHKDAETVKKYFAESR